jgi:hypothetical protein
VNSAECILCMRCMTEACRFEAISLQCAGLPFSLSPKKPRSLKIEQC